MNFLLTNDDGIDAPDFGPRAARSQSWDES